MTNIEELINKVVEASIVNSFARQADRMAESMANEILKDPATRARFIQLTRQAFDKALENMSKEK